MALSEPVITLREARMRRAWSQSDLAQAAQTHTATITRIELTQHLPRPSTRRKIARALGLEPWEIIWQAPSQRMVS